MKAVLALFAALLITATCWFIFIGSKTPHTNLNWEASQSKVVTTSYEGDTLTFYNLRNWTYASSTISQQEWFDEFSVKPDKLTDVWFLLEPFAAWKAVGHTYLTFEFSDGNNISFSVEARREIDEDYSALQGMLRSYELSYTWGTERDLLTRRLLYLQHPLRMYPLTIDTEIGKQILLSLAAQTNEIAENPRFYNTLFANCTNVLASEINHRYPNSVPYDLSWNLPGFSDTFLIEQNYIQSRGDVDETISYHDLTPYRHEIELVATSSAASFSESVRALLR